jgi:hypothetical protein
MSRVTINAEATDELELTVLNTGTPTAGKDPGQFGFNFSVIDIYPHSGAKITQYRSDGGPFNSKPSFWAETVEGTGKALLRANTLQRQCRCESLQITVDIGPDGDARRTSRVREFRYVGPAPTTTLPMMVLSVETGQIERLCVIPDSPDAPVGRELEWIKRERRLQQGNIRLTRAIDKDSRPFDFRYQWHEINSYAMSAQQFHMMYPERRGDPLEFVELNLQQIPVAEATLQVRDCQLSTPATCSVPHAGWLAPCRPSARL